MVLAETACRFNGHMDGNEKQRADSCSPLFLFSILSLSLSLSGTHVHRQTTGKGAMTTIALEPTVDMYSFQKETK